MLCVRACAFVYVRVCVCVAYLDSYCFGPFVHLLIIVPPAASCCLPAVRLRYICQSMTCTGRESIVGGSFPRGNAFCARERLTPRLPIRDIRLNACVVAPLMII